MEEKLIALFRNNPCLYNKHSKEFSYLKKRNQMLGELSKRLKVPVRKLKDRWRTLRDTYQKEKRRLAADPYAARKWKWMDHMAFLDEKSDNTLAHYGMEGIKKEYSETLISETTKDYFDDTGTEYDKTNSSWNDQSNYGNAQNDDNDFHYITDEDYFEPQVKKIKADLMSNCLLIPTDQRRKCRRQKTIKSEEYSESNSVPPKNNGEDEVLMDIKTEEDSALNNDLPWEPSKLPTNKSSIKLFCDSLAVQIEEANLTQYQISVLQIEFLKKLQEFLPKDK